MNRCDKYMEEVSLLLDGELPESGKAELLEHLKTCGECRKYCELMKSVSDTLEIVPAPEGFSRNVMAAVGEAAAKNDKRAAPRRRKLRRSTALKFAAMAACLALMAAAGAKLISPAANAPGAQAEGTAAGFVRTESELEPGSAEPAQANGDWDVVDRDFDEEDFEDGSPASSDDCTGGIESVTVMAGNVVTHMDDSESIAELAAILSYGSTASGLPGEQADYLLELECAEGERSISVYADGEELVCAADSGAVWVAAGTAGELDAALN